MSARTSGLAAHYLRYSTGNVLVILAGLVSFPVLTRLLDNTQYGILNYYDTWVLMAIAIGKLGAQHAILRFYPHGGDEDRLHAFSTNLFYLPLAVSTLLWAAAAIGLALFDLTTGARQPGVFWLALFAAPLMIFASLVETVLRATENSRMVMLTRVGWRWLELVVMLSAVLLLQHSAFAAYGGKLVAAVLVVGWYLRWVRGNLRFSRRHLDVGSMRSGLYYGLPLVANEIIAVALVTLDRVMIKSMTGDFAAVGIYSIGAALAMQVNTFTNVTVFEAFTPAVNRVYQLGAQAGASESASASARADSTMANGNMIDAGAAAAVRALKQRFLLPMTYAAAGVAMLLWCFGSDVIIALSGHTKVASGPVFTGIAVVYALAPVLMVSGYGLLLERRSMTVMLLMGITLAVNAGLNLLWLPMFGVMGAVYATAVSSMLLAVLHCVAVPRVLLQLPDARTVLTAAAVAALLIWMVSVSGVGGLASGWPRLIVGGGGAALLYAALVVSMDGRVRAVLPSLPRRRAPAAG